MSKETWKATKYPGIEVSNKGDVWGAEVFEIGLPPTVCVRCPGRRSIHLDRLVLSTFRPMEDLKATNHVPRHLNGDFRDCSLGNLMWVRRAQVQEERDAARLEGLRQITATAVLGGEPAPKKTRKVTGAVVVNEPQRTVARAASDNLFEVITDCDGPDSRLGEDKPRAFDIDRV
jgi:hypothetical protein